MVPGFLVLENGAVFKGKIPSWQEGSFGGEVVFTTGMCGYPESLTDPSFAGQILVFTYPLIGNYGVCSTSGWESGRIQTAGVVMSESCTHWSHHSGLNGVGEWLERSQVPLITEVDTRALTKLLRSRGTMRGWISTSSEVADKEMAPILRPQAEKRTFGSGTKRVIVVDCGIKAGIIRALEKLPLRATVVSPETDYSTEQFDAVFLSNGPGDPKEYEPTVQVLKKVMQREKPIFGVCLGMQLMARAAGAETYKLPFGHRGQNQPCLELKSNRCYITSQNHGYAVDPSTLLSEWEVTFRNLNDGSVEGIAHRNLPFYSVQFHPEASPGPTDTAWFFERFAQTIKEGCS